MLTRYLVASYRASLVKLSPALRLPFVVPSPRYIATHEQGLAPEKWSTDERPFSPRRKNRNRQIHPAQEEHDYTRLEPPWEDIQLHLQQEGLSSLPPRPQEAAPIKRMPRVAVCENTPLMLSKLEDMKYCNHISVNDTFGPPPDHADWLPKKKRRKIHCTKHFRRPTDAIWYMVNTKIRDVSKKAVVRNQARTRLVAALEVATRSLTFEQRKFYRGRLLIFKANANAVQADMNLLIDDMKDAIDRLAKLPIRGPPTNSKRNTPKKMKKPFNKLPELPDRGPRRLPEPAPFTPRRDEA